MTEALRSSPLAFVQPGAVEKVSLDKSLLPNLHDPVHLIIPIYKLRIPNDSLSLFSSKVPLKATVTEFPL